MVNIDRTTGLGTLVSVLRCFLHDGLELVEPENVVGGVLPTSQAWSQLAI